MLSLISSLWPRPYVPFNYIRLVRAHFFGVNHDNFSTQIPNFTACKSYLVRARKLLCAQGEMTLCALAQLRGHIGQDVGN
jgi:hypothetical protein